MKVLSILIVHNAAEILNFHFRHYDRFVDEYWVFDDRSTDDTRALLAGNPRVKRHDLQNMEGLYEEQNQGIIYEHYPKAVGKFDWVVAADPDEFLVGQVAKAADRIIQNERAILRYALDKGYEVVQSTGFNLIGPEFPKDDGRQIYEINPMGVRAPIYSKPIVWQPHVQIQWMRGKHQIENCNPVMSPPILKLLHARYFGAEYTRRRNAENYHRLGLMNGDKGPGWSVSPDYDGEQLEGSPKWSEWAATQSFNVLEAAI